MAAQSVCSMAPVLASTRTVPTTSALRSGEFDAAVPAKTALVCSTWAHRDKEVPTAFHAFRLSAVRCLQGSCKAQRFQQHLSIYWQRLDALRSA